MITGPVVHVGGRALVGWESVDISTSMSQLCGTFGIAQAAQGAQPSARAGFLPIFPGDRVSIELAGVSVLVGWVDRVTPKVDARSHSIGVEGREITADLVDCGIEGPTAWKNVSLDQLAAALVKPYGIKYLPGGADTGERFSRFSAEPGETVFQTLQKAANLRGLLWTTTRAGDLTLTTGRTGKCTDRLVYGINILSASADYSNKDRFSRYVVRGQSSPGPGTYFAAAKSGGYGSTAAATDPDVDRYRPLVLVSGSGDTRDGMQRRANWEASTRRAKSNTLEVVVQGWTQTDGTLWECGKSVSVEIPYLLGPDSKEFQLSAVRYTYGPGGTLANLSLILPDAFEVLPKNTQPKTKKGKVDAWSGVRAAVNS